MFAPLLRVARVWLRGEILSGESRYEVRRGSAVCTRRHTLWAASARFPHDGSEGPRGLIPSKFLN
jgi:hypothetical protein